MPELIFLIFLSLYFILSAVLLVGVRKKFPTLSDDEIPSLSVIVAARNEKDNILRCLVSLDNLKYPEGKIEIILVDDNSTDNTGKIIDEFIFNKNKFKKIVTGKEIGRLKGKTNAIANAIEISKGEIILTTDADCEVSPEWAYRTASYYLEDVAMVNGFTNQLAYNNFSGLQAVDFIYLLTVAAGCVNLRFPISCIGNNMSYRKSVYEEIGGYQNLPFSVTEDSLLLHRMNRLKKYKIIYPLDKKALVTSVPCKNLKELYRQKKRWSVGGLDVPKYSFAVMGISFVTNVCLFVTPLFFSPVWLYLAVFKLAIDFFVLYPVHRELGIVKNLKYFFSFQIYYIIYAVITPFVLLFSRKVIWKNREYK
jgi:cellulose synthase/poly-beta-1,6-N-acetylglucosamine synthase-like glycosyltransferase